jgi:hypothetical protein
MADDLIERYERLRDRIGIDLLDMEHMFQMTPQTLQQAGELAAAADLDLMIAKHNRDIAVATTASRIREAGGPDRPVTRLELDLKTMVPLDPDVRTAQQAVWEATYVSDLCTALFKVWDTQSRLLGKAADMVNSGYIAPHALDAAMRSEISSARDAMPSAEMVREKMARMREETAEKAQAEAERAVKRPRGNGRPRV